MLEKNVITRYFSTHTIMKQYVINVACNQLSVIEFDKNSIVGKVSVGKKTP